MGAALFFLLVMVLVMGSISWRGAFFYLLLTVVLWLCGIAALLALLALLDWG